jgi:1,4-dihydroxy-2-naphthoate octaprenyltransferase
MELCQTMQEKKISWFKTWFTAIRPFALPVSTMPVVYGTVMAVTVGNASLNIPLFITAFFAMVILHSGANILSDVNDFRKGLDKVPTPASGAIVRGYISPKKGLAVSIALLATGTLLGAILVYYSGIVILVIGVIGLILGVFYTVGPFALKYHALGDLAVFLDFGILGAMGSWTVQTGKVSWVPALWAVPMSLHVVAILHANNWRDIGRDVQKEIKTMASIFGDRGSMVYYGFLIFGPFGIIVLLVLMTGLFGLFGPVMPFTFLIIFFAFPGAFKLIRRGKSRLKDRDSLDFIALDAGTSKLTLYFGLLCTAALILHAVIARWIA